jgi:hypothetical protein
MTIDAIPNTTVIFARLEPPIESVAPVGADDEFAVAFDDVVPGAPHVKLRVL